MKLLNLFKKKQPAMLLICPVMDKAVLERIYHRHKWNITGCRRRENLK